ncbi:MAG: SufE family protein [Bacteroidia bacterium]|jgi:cysteine desulfuration protein SufE|nr:SufE family protein [Bacteroidia bacterium]
MRIVDIENEIIEEFELFGDDWEGKYEHLIELGKSLPKIVDTLKTEDRIIKGCQSKVWLHSEKKDGEIIYTADSDAIITKGMVALMIRVLSHQKPQDILAANLDFINKIGLTEHLSPTRANGLLSMIKQMKLDAMALS